ncbi:SMI1/KNR4 family protein [Streptomyces sp. NPDC059161]|uniref:SMI1/KNR4 family protein n=1 Tax=Streptomyces sp. NPDC059161 TaxID=3346749 RepID=UPI0036771001
MGTQMSGLTQVWHRFEAWLAEHAPDDYASLRPGASKNDVKRLEDGLGFALHQDMGELLRLRNGVTMRRASTEPGAFLLGYSLLDVDGILEAHRDLVSMVQEAREEGEEDVVVGRTADGRWVPLAQDVSGDLLFVDHRYHSAGEIGEISFGDPEYRMLWPRLDLMLTNLCNSLEHRTPVTAIPRVPSLHEGRMVEWHVHSS